jgi:hypothetical protein
MKLGPHRRLNPAEASAMARALLEKGLPPATVRRRLAEYGVKWQYGFVAGHQNTRERLRRLRQQGMAGLCSVCQANGYPVGSTVDVCQDCLEKKWQETPTVRRNGHGSPQ